MSISVRSVLYVPFSHSSDGGVTLVDDEAVGKLCFSSYAGACTSIIRPLKLCSEIWPCSAESRLGDGKGEFDLDLDGLPGVFGDL